MNPFADTLSFLLRNQWPIYIFWVLLLGSIGIAVINLLHDPEQRTGAHVWMWLARLFLGGLWWQQTLWKLPPTYTDNPDGVSGGLHYWVGEMVQHSAFGIQSWLVEKLIQPHFYVFAPQVYLTEVLIAISLLLGVFTRIGGALGALMALNLWLGLYRAHYEWPWTYFFLIVLQIMFAVLHAGRSLGIDAMLARRQQAQPKPEGVTARMLGWLT
ncbi:MAG: DoxX family membrane protein [Nitrospinae bacterium]|nr:DoxX family membrane protein [Nitrospinota bacterium]